jgi:hypothetical protein
MPESTGGDQTVDPRTDRHSSPSPRPIELSPLLEDLLMQGRFDDRQSQQTLTSPPESALFSKSLEDLLDHREAGDDLVQRNFLFEPNPARFAEDLDPDRGIDKEHGKGESSGGPGRGGVVSHLSEVPFPESGACQLEETPHRSRCPLRLAHPIQGFFNLPCKLDIRCQDLADLDSQSRPDIRILRIVGRVPESLAHDRLGFQLRPEQSPEHQYGAPPLGGLSLGHRTPPLPEERQIWSEEFDERGSLDSRAHVLELSSRW